MPDASHVASANKIPWQNLEEPGQAELLKEIYRVYFCPVHLPWSEPLLPRELQHIPGILKKLLSVCSPNNL